MGKQRLKAWSWGSHYVYPSTWTILACTAYRKREGYYMWIVRIVGLDHVSDKHAQARARRLSRDSGLPLYPGLRNHMIVTPEQVAQMTAAVGGKGGSINIEGGQS